MNHPLPENLQKAQRPALIVGIVALAFSLLGLLISPAKDFFLGYVLGFVLWTGLTIGCLAVLMLQHLVGGTWGLLIRRPLESAARMTWIMAVLAVPVLFGLRYLYIWFDHPAEKSDFQQWYLRPGFWVIRTFIYFGIWFLLSFFLSRWSEQQDASDDPRLAKWMERLSAIGLVLYAITITLAAVDWVMSMSPEWISTMYGFIFITGEGLLVFAVMVLILAAIHSSTSVRAVVRRTHFHDIGNMMLTFLLLWAYVSFSQYLLIWSGNIKDETTFYVYRLHNGLQYVAILLIAAGFFIPFFCLLSSKIKRSLRAFCYLAVFVIFTRILDLFWIVIPSYSQGHNLPPTSIFHLHYQYLLPLIGIGGIWIAIYIRELGRLPLLPVHDPRLALLEAEHA